MVSGINTSYTNSYSGAAQSRGQMADSVSNGENAQTLDEFKREMYNTINRMSVHPSQSNTQISINISDKAFERMMHDPEYKDLMLRTIQRDLGGAYPAAATPSYSIIRIGDDCEYKADAMGSAYGATFSAAKSDSFVRKNTKKTSFDYDDYYRRNAIYRQAEKRLQEKRIADRETAEDLREQKLAQSRQRAKAAFAYDNPQDYDEEGLCNGNYRG